MIACKEVSKLINVNINTSIKLRSTSLLHNYSETNNENNLTLICYITSRSLFNFFPSSTSSDNIMRKHNEPAFYASFITDMM